jgi:hypothetical protein
MPVVASATDRLAAIDSSVAPRPVLQPHSRGTGGNHAPAVDIHFGQSLSIGVGLLVERYSTPYTGLVTFITSYFAMFWLAWRVAVRITRPRSRVAAE